MDVKPSLGIGCFHFGINITPPYTFTGREYIEKLKERLESIPNIGNLNLDVEDEFLNESFELNENPHEIRSGKDVFPKPNFMEIEFDINLPYRVQTELLNKFGFDIRDTTEKFKIHIIYTYYMPVTFIEPIDPKCDEEPSTFVTIIRAFLEREFRKNSADYIRFEFLGPSPFHADCYIHEFKKTDKDIAISDRKFQAQRRQSLGYDEILLYYNPVLFKDSEDAIYYIKPQISDELGLFYYIQAFGNLQMNYWDDIEQDIKRLIQIQKNRA